MISSNSDLSNAQTVRPCESARTRCARTPSAIGQRALPEIFVLGCEFHASVCGHRRGCRILGGSISGFECCRLSKARFSGARCPTQSFWPTRSPHAHDEREWGKSSGCHRRRSFHGEVGSVDPHAVHDDGETPSQSHFRLTCSVPSRDLERPVSQPVLARQRVIMTLAAS